MREIDRSADLDAALEAGDLSNRAIQGLDCSALEARLLAARVDGSLFLGCHLSTASRAHVEAAGGLVMPALDGLPYTVFRSELYSSDELFSGFDSNRPESYADTPDAKIYAHHQATGGHAPPSLRESLARRLHDHAISDAIEELVSDRKAIAIMGGHGLERAQPAYREVAWIARALAREGYLLCSGGGPGAMEATHVGAWLAPWPDDALDEALAILGPRPAGCENRGEYLDPCWLSRAFKVRERFPASELAPATSLGIPTWHYGHEPPNPFATHIGKYFANSVREDGLVSLATYGIVFAPGSAGTIQEIFQDACQNHYGSLGVISPMIFLGVDYWSRVKPVYPLLERLAEGLPYADLLALTDDPSVVVERLRREQLIHV